ncbi:hypothetical protein Mevan_0288 [Methanococcus vannielii SB]|uniref:Uncharacterized protein n=1 Tax=Methanococcus vannielii (strain ATCC 35089 / DSM 1224 / JCM 13029 / OCM 148 / SB) TaxID=406327 RepID=A6UNX5_METVS|nr:hypothetical protein [Methanococcus vannielii]ABR54197.1 hypothetical protein Mevan_0288 [Methanococcus vannielii SB]
MLVSVANGQVIQEAWLGIYKYNGTYYDPLGGSFEGNSNYEGQHYYYSVISYVMDDGTTKRQVFKLEDNRGETSPAPTAVLDVKYPNGTTDTYFKQVPAQGSPQTVPQDELPIVTKIPLGSTISMVLNDNYRDNNYGDGLFLISISEDGSKIDIERKMHIGTPGFFHNNSLILTDRDTGEHIEIKMTYKPSGGQIDDIISIDVKNAISKLKNNLNGEEFISSLYPVLNPLSGNKPILKLPIQWYFNLAPFLMILYFLKYKLE